MLHRLHHFHAWPVRVRLRVVALGAFAFGVLLVVALHALPRHVVTRHAYCTLCALHSIETEETSIFHFDGMPFEGLFLARTVVTREGVLHHLLAPVVGEHRHAWIDPAPFVPPTNPAKKLPPPMDFRQAVAEAEVSELERLEESPHLVALLDQAMHDDRARTVKFVQKIIDPAAYVGVDAIALLDRSTSWEARWQIVDAFFDVYRCAANDVSVSCRMHLGATDLIVLARTASSVHTGGVDWSRWVPEGTPSPPGESSPTSFAVVTN